MDIDPAWLETDLYAVLGVDAGASSAEVTKAYRRLARALHPDTNPDAGAEQRFREASTAYDVLRDPEKRAAYDRARQLARSGARRRPGGGYTIRVDKVGDVGIRDRPGRSMFDDLLGVSSRRPGSPRHPGSGPRSGADVRCEITVPFTAAVLGTTMSVEVPGGGTTTVPVPAGVDDGQTIRIRGGAAAGRRGGRTGDLLVTVRIEPHRTFGRVGDDLTVTVPVTYSEAALGADVAVPTVDGDGVTVRMPPGTPAGRVLRVRGRGVPTGHGRGDLLVTVRVDVPRHLDDRQRELLRELAEHDAPGLRDHLRT